MLMAIAPTVLVIIISFIFLLLPGEKNEIVQSLVVLPFSFVFNSGNCFITTGKSSFGRIGIKEVFEERLCDMY